MRSGSDTQPARGRVLEVDALRGFALLGIIAVNSTQIAGSWGLSTAPGPAPDALAGEVTRVAISVVFATKFYVLFSFLFGYSFTLQIDAADRAGARFHRRFLRRLAGLFVLGLAHAVFLYPGDILMTYAVLGLVLLALRDLEPRSAVRGAVGLLGLLAALYALLAVLSSVALGPQPRSEQQIPAGQLTAQYRESAAGVIAANLDILPSVISSILVFQGPSAFAMFLFGLAAGKLRLLADGRLHSQTLRRVTVAGLSVGAPGSVLYALAVHGYLNLAGTILALGMDLLTAPALSAAYAAGLLLLMRGKPGRWLGRGFAPAGRLALTNYLSQSLLLALVFTAYGLGLYNHLGGVPVLGVAIAVYAAQLLLSAVWVRYLRYGPAEWALRALTYARFPPMRR